MKYQCPKCKTIVELELDKDEKNFNNIGKCIEMMFLCYFTDRATHNLLLLMLQKEKQEAV